MSGMVLIRRLHIKGIFGGGCRTRSWLHPLRASFRYWSTSGLGAFVVGSFCWLKTDAGYCERDSLVPVFTYGRFRASCGRARTICLFVRGGHSVVRHPPRYGDLCRGPLFVFLMGAPTSP